MQCTGLDIRLRHQAAEIEWPRQAAASVAQSTSQVANVRLGSNRFPPQTLPKGA